MKNLSDNNEPDFEPDPFIDYTGRELLGISFASLVFYLLIATILFYFFHDGGLFELFLHGFSFPMQFLTGVLAGGVAAVIILFFSTRPPVEQVLDDFVIFRMISHARFSVFDRIQVSFFAGVGEEILFRGAIQPLLGIWVTSVLFIALHGYISFRTSGHTLFTLLLFALSLMLGVLYETAGLVSAMAAHAVYDLVMLWWVGMKQENKG